MEEQEWFIVKEIFLLILIINLWDFEVEEGKVHEQFPIFASLVGPHLVGCELREVAQKPSKCIACIMCRCLVVTLVVSQFPSLSFFIYFFIFLLV